MFQAKSSPESVIPEIYSVPQAGLKEDPSGFLQELENCGSVATSSQYQRPGSMCESVYYQFEA